VREKQVPANHKRERKRKRKQARDEVYEEEKRAYGNRKLRGKIEEEEKAAAT
jgi:hypothetical protein